MKKTVLLVALLLSVTCFGQIERVEPPNWWIGMNEPSLQLMVHGKDIGAYTVSTDHQGVEVVSTHQADSPNFLFIDLIIKDQAKAGTVEFVFKSEGKERLKFNYPLLPRKKLAVDFKGFDSSDVIYLITPDRFANGDPQNDIVEGLRETKIDRKDDYARHGGDIKGITQSLEYIDRMGFTAIWSCPLLINDMDRTSYHGYAITDLYTIDPRFGNLEDYQSLSAKASEKGIKLIMDQVANHCGSKHWWMSDLPFKDWVNYQANFEKGEPTVYSNHRRTTNQDIYASKADTKLMADGWFVDSMPDLNQRNPFMATYLIQNSIWWIETAQLGGIRQDTYPYPDKKFMSDWAGAIMKEYPNFSIVGEEWSYNPLLVGYWQSGAKNRDGYESNLRSSMDFPIQRHLVEALNEEESWDKGLIKMYEGLANDFHYPKPIDIMAFTDNHDMDRIHTQLKENPVKTKMAMAFLLAIPRIPQIYYGTEILMQNSAKPGDHGLIRTDFPGGWKSDRVNAFDGTGLSEPQKDMQNYLRALLNYRKSSNVIATGNTLHFAPRDGVYVLFRFDEQQTLMAVFNKNTKPYQLEMDRFKEMNIEGKQAEDVISGKRFNISETLTLTKQGALWLQINN